MIHLKKIKFARPLIILLAFLVQTACDDGEALDQIGDPEFYVRLSESLPSTAYPNIPLEISAEAFAKTGIVKVETRMDFQTIEGSEQVNFDSEFEGIYNFTFVPGREDLGKKLEFVIVAYDRSGQTYATSYSVSVVAEPVMISIEIPEDLPDSLEVGQVLTFDAVISSEDELSKIESLVGDTVLEDLSVENFENPFQAIYSFEYEFTEEDAGADIAFTIKATDVEQKVKEIEFVVSVAGSRAPKPVKSYENVNLGMQSNTVYGQFIDFVNNKTYTVPDAKANSALIDFGTFRSGSSGINLFVPSYENAATFIYNSANWGEDNLGSWTVRNATELRKISPDVLTEEAFNTMTDDELMINAFEGSEPTVETVTGATVGDIIGFKTVGGKYGLILVKDLVAESSGSITFDYKIQE